MKYIITTIIFILLAAGVLIAQSSIHDKTSQSSRTGTGSFTVTTIKHICVDDDHHLPDNDEFEQEEHSCRDYDGYDYHYYFKIGGEEHYNFCFDTYFTPPTGPVTFEVEWRGSDNENDEGVVLNNESSNQGTLNGSGNYYIKCKIRTSTVHDDAHAGETYNFETNVTASYNDE